MRTAIALQFEIHPRPDQGVRECLAAAREEVVEWVCGALRRLGIHTPPPAFDGGRASPHKGHEIRSDQRDCPTHRLASLQWELPDAGDASLVWQFSSVLACDARLVEAALTIGVEKRPWSLRPLRWNLDRANPLHSFHDLRDALLRGRNCHIGNRPIPTRVRLLRRGQIGDFVRELTDPTRVLPVFLFDFTADWGMDAQALQAIQNHVVGYVHLAALLDREAGERLTKLVGSEHSCRDGGLRAYWPGFRREDPPKSHPLQGFEEVRNNIRTYGALEWQFRRHLWLLTTDQFREGKVIQAARAALAEDQAVRLRDAAPEALAAVRAELRKAEEERRRLRQEADAAGRNVRALLGELSDLRERVDALRAAVPTHDESFDELAAELEQAWDENKRLRAAYEDARKRAAELEQDFRTYLDGEALYREPASASEGAPAVGNGEGFATTAEALRAAAARFDDVLAVWEDAIRSAEQSLFASPAKVFQALTALAEVGRAYFAARDGGPALGPVDRAFAARVPFKYTGFESPTTMGLFGGERVFHDGERSRRMQRHLTLGGGTTNNCLQIYFDFDDAERRVQVGYCGRHLPFAGQRT